MVHKKGNSEPLKGLVCLVETVNDDSSDASEANKVIVKSLGGTVAPSFGEDITHYITSGHNAKRIKGCAAFDITVVSPLWLESCRESKSRVPEIDFLVSASASNSQSTSLNRQPIVKVTEPLANKALTFRSIDSPFFSSSSRRESIVDKESEPSAKKQKLNKKSTATSSPVPVVPKPSDVPLPVFREFQAPPIVASNKRRSERLSELLDSDSEVESVLGRASVSRATTPATVSAASGVIPAVSTRRSNKEKYVLAHTNSNNIRKEIIGVESPLNNNNSKGRKSSKKGLDPTSLEAILNIDATTVLPIMNEKDGELVPIEPEVVVLVKEKSKSTRLSAVAVVAPSVVTVGSEDSPEVKKGKKGGKKVEESIKDTSAKGKKIVQESSIPAKKSKAVVVEEVEKSKSVTSQKPRVTIALSGYENFDDERTTQNVIIQSIAQAILDSNYYHTVTKKSKSKTSSSNSSSSSSSSSVEVISSYETAVTTLASDAEDDANFSMLIINEKNRTRTYRVLLAIVRGLCIVSSTWLDECASAEKWVDPLNCRFPRYANLKLGQRLSIFHGKKFYIPKSTTMSPERLHILITEAGGIVTNSQLDVAQKIVDYVVFGCPEDAIAWSKEVKSKTSIVNEVKQLIQTKQVVTCKFICNCIGSAQLKLPLRGEGELIVTLSASNSSSSAVTTPSASSVVEDSIDESDDVFVVNMQLQSQEKATQISPWKANQTTKRRKSAGADTSSTSNKNGIASSVSTPASKGVAVKSTSSSVSKKLTTPSKVNNSSSSSKAAVSNVKSIASVVDSGRPPLPSGSKKRGAAEIVMNTVSSSGGSTRARKRSCVSSAEKSLPSSTAKVNFNSFDLYSSAVDGDTYVEPDDFDAYSMIERVANDSILNMSLNLSRLSNFGENTQDAAGSLLQLHSSPKLRSQSKSPSKVTRTSSETSSRKSPSKNSNVIVLDLEDSPMAPVVSTKSKAKRIDSDDEVEIVSPLKVGSSGVKYGRKKLTKGNGQSLAKRSPVKFNSWADEDDVIMDTQ